MTKSPTFYFDYEQILTNQKCFILTGKTLGYLTSFFNSCIFRVCFNSNFPILGNGLELSKVFFEKIPVLKINPSLDLSFTKKIKEIQELNIDCQKRNNLINDLENQIFDIYNLNKKEREVLTKLDSNKT